jgi:hypothetical protein
MLNLGTACVMATRNCTPCSTFAAVNVPFTNRPMRGHRFVRFVVGYGGMTNCAPRAGDGMSVINNATKSARTHALLPILLVFIVFLVVSTQSLRLRMARVRVD